MPRRPRAPRVRRDPETARALLLDAAERVFARRHPDDAGLKQVADEAGVSHALITHYFGTYRGLVEATLERRMRALRARVLARMTDASVIARPGELLALLFESLEDPVHLRLMRWFMGSERASSAESLGLRDHGIQLIAAQLASVLAPEPPRELVDKLEVAIAVAVAASYGYATGKHALANALGRKPSPALDTAVRETLAGMLQSYLRDFRK